jgi:hypothetical protein
MAALSLILDKIAGANAVGAPEQFPRFGFFSICLAGSPESNLELKWSHAWEASGAALFEARAHF